MKQPSEALPEKVRQQLWQMRFSPYPNTTGTRRSLRLAGSVFKPRRGGVGYKAILDAGGCIRATSDPFTVFTAPVILPQVGVVATLAGELYAVGGHDTFAHLRAVFLFYGCRQQGFRRLGGHGYLQIDTVQQRAGDASTVLGHLLRSATAGLEGVTQMTSGAGVHGSHQLEAGREGCSAAGAGDVSLPGFQGFAQYIQHAAGEFGYFIEEQDVVVGQGHFARPGIAAAAGQGNSRSRVVGSPELALFPAPVYLSWAAVCRATGWRAWTCRFPAGR